MIDVTVVRDTINPERLHDDLKAAFGEECSGLSFAGGVVTVHLSDAATVGQQLQARQIVETHDPALLTPAQQAARDRDALPFFALPLDVLVAHAGGLDPATFQQEMARAFAYLRDLVRGGSSGGSGVTG